MKTNEITMMITRTKSGVIHRLVRHTLVDLPGRKVVVVQTACGRDAPPVAAHLTDTSEARESGRLCKTCYPAKDN